MILLRSFLFNIVLYTYLLLSVLILNIFAFMPGWFYVKSVKLWGKLLGYLQFWMVGLDFEVRGLEDLPTTPVLLAAKHQSTWDTWILPHFFIHPAVVLKHELLWIPGIRMVLNKLGYIAIVRNGGSKALQGLIADSAQAISEHRPILIFPEGTRCAPGTTPNYKSGIALLYDRLNIPCVPIALNSGLFWPRRKGIYYPGKIVVEVLKPIPPGLPRKEFMRRLQNELETACNNLIDEVAHMENPPPTLADANACRADRKNEA